MFKKKEVKNNKEELKEEDTKKQKSLKQQVADLQVMFDNPDKIKEMVEQSKQYKNFVKRQRKFKLPASVMAEAKKAYKRSKILIILLKRDRTIDFKVVQMMNGMIYIGDTPHQCATDFVFMVKGKIPCLVIKEWDLEPVGTEDYYVAVEKGRTTEPATIILRAIEEKQRELEQKKISGKTLLWIILGAAVIIGLFMMNK